VRQVACITGSQQQGKLQAGSWLMSPMAPSARDLTTILSTAQRSYRPNSLQLSPGDNASLFLHLMPPAAAEGQQQAVQEHNAASGMLLVPQASPAGSLDLLSAGGILKHIFSFPAASPISNASRPTPAAASVQRAPTAGAKGCTKGSDDQQTGTISSGSPGLLPADPSVDLLVAWQVAINHDGSRLGRDPSSYMADQRQQVRRMHCQYMHSNN
jgi:hypothetical protein